MVSEQKKNFFSWEGREQCVKEAKTTHTPHFQSELCTFCVAGLGRDNVRQTSNCFCEPLPVFCYVNSVQ